MTLLMTEPKCHAHKTPQDPTRMSEKLVGAVNLFRGYIFCCDKIIFWYTASYNRQKYADCLYLHHLARFSLVNPPPPTFPAVTPRTNPDFSFDIFTVDSSVYFPIPKRCYSRDFLVKYAIYAYFEYPYTKAHDIPRLQQKG